MQSYFEHGRARWILPTVASAALPLLLLHKSATPVVFQRYSIDYAVLLFLAAVNLGLLWRTSYLRVSYPALCLCGALVVVFTFLFDFFVLGLGLPFILSTETAWANSVLLLGCLLQMNTPRRLLKRIYPRWKPLVTLKDVALVGCSIMIMVILAELVFRFVLLERLTPKNQRELVRLMSTQWQEPIPIAKPEGTFRILGLADSFGVVGGTSANYHYLLEAMLRRQLRPGIQMVNVSVTGYAPRHELAILRLALPYSPDIVLHGFFVGNDFTLYGADTYQYGAIRIDDEPGISRHRPRHFFLTDLIRNGLLLLRDQRQVRFEQRTGVVDGIGYLSEKVFYRHAVPQDE